MIQTPVDVITYNKQTIEAPSMSPMRDVHVKGGIKQLIIVKRIPQMIVLRKTSVATQMRMYAHGA